MVGKTNAVQIGSKTRTVLITNNYAAGSQFPLWVNGTEIYHSGQASITLHETDGMYILLVAGTNAGNPCYLRDGYGDQTVFPNTEIILSMDGLSICDFTLPSDAGYVEFELTNTP